METGRIIALATSTGAQEFRRLFRFVLQKESPDLLTSCSNALVGFQDPDLRGDMNGVRRRQELPVSRDVERFIRTVEGEGDDFNLGLSIERDGLDLLRQIPPDRQVTDA